MSTPIINITGQKFGSLIPLKTEKINGKTKWLCQCDCGNQCYYNGYNLLALKRNGNFPTCGCSRINFNGKTRSIVGIETTLIKVLSFDKDTNLYHCINKKGKEEWLKATTVKSRINRSLDFDKKSNNKLNIALSYGYNSYKEYIEASIALHHKLIMMRERCYNKNHDKYKYYGERGILICKEWLENPKEFVHWAMLNGFKKGLQIDRIDNNKNYSPENCRIVSRITNMNNKSNNFYIEINGERKSLAEWCRKFSLNYKRTHALIRYKNKTLEEIIKESGNQSTLHAKSQE